MLHNIHLFNAGYCYQWRYLADAQGWGLRRFYAVFLYFEHPQHGPMLIDTGYSPDFFKATRPFPQRFYSWLTPAKLAAEQHAAAILAAHGLDPLAIRYIFLSHLHADHVAGLGYFPQARIVYEQTSYTWFMAQDAWTQVRHAFLKDLLPATLASQGQGLKQKDFQACCEGLADFACYDFFADGSVLIVALPGHARGHCGFVLKTRPKSLFYVADACWNKATMLRAQSLPGPSRGVQDSFQAYQQTQARLCKLDLERFDMLACHCPLTQQRVVNAQY